MAVQYCKITAVIYRGIFIALAPDIDLYYILYLLNYLFIFFLRVMSVVVNYRGICVNYVLI